MKNFMLLTVLLLVSVTTRGDTLNGYAAFFYLNDPDTDSAVYADFAWHLNNATPWLEERGVVVSYHDSLPLNVETAAGTWRLFSGSRPELDLGFVLLTPDGRHEIAYGVHTDADIMARANSFFKLTLITA